MLRDLHIRNLAVVEEAAIEFGPGLNVLTGETGAGKSIVVDSLALLSGIRASTDQIRTGAETLLVTGIFDPPAGAGALLAEAGVEGGSELVVRREISRTGRNRVFVNDCPVTLKLLADLAPSLLRLHGQREELGLVAPELQRTWLDRCGGPEAEGPLARAAETHAAYRQLAARLERLTGDERAVRERIDLLRFQLSEIDAAELTAGEEDELRREREVLRHAEAIREGLDGCRELLFEREGSAYEALHRSQRLLEDVEAWEPGAGGWARELEELRIRLGELDSALARRRDEVESDPGRLNAVEDRLALLERLLRKYGGTSHAVLEHRRTVVADLDELEGDESSRDALAAQVEEALAAYRAAAAELSRGRRTWAEEMVRRVTKHLRELALGKARFAVELERRKRHDSPLRLDGEAIDFSEAGFDQVVYTFSPNPGEELRPLARVASGGELARLYLAVQLAARGDSKVASSATLVFDEVDAGVGGAEAASLGKKLRRLARGGQILAVTHLPQVASCADLHFKVSKQVHKGRTRTAVDVLADGAQIEEVARMLAGREVTDLSLSHARELIAEGRSDSRPAATGPSSRRG